MFLQWDIWVKFSLYPCISLIPFFSAWGIACWCTGFLGWSPFFQLPEGVTPLSFGFWGCRWEDWKPGLFFCSGVCNLFWEVPESFYYPLEIWLFHYLFNYLLFCICSFFSIWQSGESHLVGPVFVLHISLFCFSSLSFHSWVPLCCLSLLCTLKLVF